MPINLTIQLKHIGKKNPKQMVNCQRDKDAVLYHQWIKMASSQGLYLQLVETAHPVALHKGYTLKDNQ